MNKELNLQIPDSLFNSLKEEAEKQGISMEVLCISILGTKQSLIEPGLYSTLSNQDVRKEIQNLLQSDLPKVEQTKRVKMLNLQITRFIR